MFKQNLISEQTTIIIDGEKRVNSMKKLAEFGSTEMYAELCLCVCLSIQ